MDRFSAEAVLATELDSVQWTDVRPARAFIRGMLRGSSNVPFPFQTVQAFNPVRPTIILGPAGPTARTAAEQWYQSGYPVKGYVDAPFTIIQRLATPHLIQLAEVVSATALKEWSGLLLDVRLPEDAVRRIIPGSVWIPLDNLRRAIPTLPHDRPILTYCNSGSKAVVAAAELLSAGFDRVAVIP